MVEWRRTLLNLNPAWEHVLWDERRLRDHGFDYEQSHEQLGSWAAVSNAFRLLILARFGGIYLDTDFECLRPLDELPSEGAIAALQDDIRICNAFMGARPGHPWIKWQVRNFLKYDQRDPASGVYLATEAPREDLTLVRRSLVYPFSYDTPPEKRVPLKSSILVHHWVGSWGEQKDQL